MPWRRNDPDLELALVQYQQGNYGGAVDSLKRVLGGDPENARAFALLALCRLNQERIDDASRAIATALTLDAEQSFHHWVDGLVAMARTDWTNAERAFRAAIDLDAGDPEGYFGLALLWKARMKPKRALDWLDQALKIDSEHLDSLALAADIALDRNDLARAYETAERALRINPQHLGACLVMGEVLCRQGDTEAALDHAVLALTQSPDHDGALELLALIRARRNPLFALWWRGEQAIKRLGPAFRVIAVLSIVMLYASLDWLFVGLGLLSWKYGLAAIFFPLGIYFAFGHMALSLMIELEKRKIRLSSSF